MSTNLEQLTQRIMNHNITDPKAVCEILDEFVFHPVMDVVQSAELQYQTVDIIEEAFGLKKKALYEMSMLEFLNLLGEVKKLQAFFGDTTLSEANCFFAQVLTNLLMKASNHSYEVQRFLNLRANAFFDCLEKMQTDKTGDVVKARASVHALKQECEILLEESMDSEFNEEHHLETLLFIINRSLYNNARQKKADAACSLLYILLKAGLCKAYA